MKYCPQCGSPCDDTAKFCNQCGSTLEQQAQDPAQSNSTQSGNDSYSGNAYSAQAEYNAYQNAGPNRPNNTNIAPRSIVTAIILSIVTCGIYGIYWMIKLNDEVNELSGEQNATSGGMVFLLTLVTCGIYAIYWSYKMGQRCDAIKGRKESSEILYLILSLVGLGIVNYCLMQDVINKAVE